MRRLWGGLCALAPEAPRAHEVLAIVALAEISVGDDVPRARRMDETARAGVDADVVDATRADAEKDEITRRQRSQGNRARGVPLLLRRARDFQTDAFVCVEREPAAIEALQVRAAEVIRGADKLRGDPRDGRGSLLLRLRPPRNAAGSRAAGARADAPGRASRAAAMAGVYRATQSPRPRALPPFLPWSADRSSWSRRPRRRRRSR